MRALVLGLILANILYWTWASNIDAPTPVLAPALDPDLPLLELIPRPELDEAELVGSAQSSSGTTVEVEASATSLQNGPQDSGGLDVESGANANSGGDASDIAESVAEAAETPSSAEALVDDAIDNSPESNPVSLLDSNLLAAVDPDANPARCAGVGPFVSLKQASEASAMINQAGLTTSQRVEESQVWVGHWVHLPSYPSRAAAVEVVEELREQGINDIYIEPSGELKNTISLGLFSELAGAETRAGLVRKLGDVKPQIRNRSRDGLVYWVDVSLEAGVSLDITTLPHNPEQELELKPVDCPPLSARG
ncbi:MAG: hypothetical protein AB8G18_10690 [Gammaproteobacteria bacterium]